MDPDAALEALRDLSKAIDLWTEESGLDIGAYAEEMASTFDGLDDWLSNKGGYMPKDWAAQTSVEHDIGLTKGHKDGS